MSVRHCQLVYIDMGSTLHFSKVVSTSMYWQLKHPICQLNSVNWYVLTWGAPYMSFRQFQMVCIDMGSTLHVSQVMSTGMNWRGDTLYVSHAVSTSMYWQWKHPIYQHNGPTCVWTWVGPFMSLRQESQPDQGRNASLCLVMGPSAHCPSTQGGTSLPS